jgi:2-polyprenyl-6-methoxyphenol hydroxylase-like FAD-dependent oxidoreductase
VRALICGAGIAGLTLARLLSQQGWSVYVAEHAGALRREGYLIDFLGPGFDAAEAMGVLPRLQELAYQVSEVSYVNRNGRPRAALDYERMSRSLDGRLLSMLRGDLALALSEGLGSQVEMRYHTSVRAINETPDGVDVTLTDRSHWRGDLLVGADGIHSVIRSLTFGPESEYLRFLGFHTAAFTFSDPDLHRRLGDRFAITDSRNRAVGVYALRNRRIAVFAVHRTAEPGLPDDPRAAIRATYSDLGWLVPEILEHCPPSGALYYDQVAQIEMPQWSTGHVVLVGDACQAVSLLAGQGASLAVAGAHLLADEIAGAPDLPTALSRYHARLAPAVAAKQAAGRRTAEWFLPSTLPRLLLRRLALRAMRLPGLNRTMSSQLIAGTGIP